MTNSPHSKSSPQNFFLLPQSTSPRLQWILWSNEPGQRHQMSQSITLINRSTYQLLHSPRVFCGSIDRGRPKKRIVPLLGQQMPLPGHVTNLSEGERHPNSNSSSSNAMSLHFCGPSWKHARRGEEISTGEDSWANK